MSNFMVSLVSLVLLMPLEGEVFWGKEGDEGDEGDEGVVGRRLAGLAAASGGRVAGTTNVGLDVSSTTVEECCNERCTTTALREGFIGPGLPCQATVPTFQGTALDGWF